MEEDKRQQNRPHIEVHGSYYEIHDNTFLGGTNYFGASDRQQNQDEEELDLSEESVKHAIDLLMRNNTRQNKRWWFVPYRVLKDATLVADLYGFETYINRLYGNNLPLCIDIHDLSKEVDVLSFAKPYKEWNVDDAPVGGATYKKYTELVESFTSYLKVI